MKVKINEAGMRKMYNEIAEKIAQADREFRSTHEGYPVEVVEADAPAAFPWLTFKGDGWHDYAEAVSAGKPFKFKLR